MVIKKLFLENFRRFTQAEFEFSSQTNLILGPNTSGKTTVLEAIYLLSTAGSFRAEKISEMIGWGKEIARIKADHLELVLTPGEVNAKKTPKKIFSINKVKKKKTDFIGQLLTALFLPEDLAMITGSPSRRRRFLDSILVQVNWEYRRALNSYQRALRQRNKILEQLRERQARKSDLLFWDQSLLQNGAIILKARAEVTNFINYVWPGGLRLEYQQNQFVNERNLAKEISQAMTLSGPHRDDFWLEKNERNLAVFGSRSEQRLAVLNLKMAELQFIQQETGETPLLLLDDLFSELDQSFRMRVFSLFQDHQVILTTAEPELIQKDFLKKMKKLQLSL